MRSGEGELDADVEETLVFFRQKSGRERFARPSGGQRHEAQEQEAEGGFADQRPANADVAVRQPAIAAIEPVKEPAQRAFGSLALAAGAARTRPG